MNVTLNTLCPTCGNRRKRSNPQNRLYWKILNALAEKSEYSAETYHEYCKRTFLGYVEREFPDWTTALIPISTADLPMHRDPEDPDRPNWETYMIQVERFAAENDVYLQEGM